MKIKLKDIWEYIDGIQDYIVWYADTPNDEFKKKEGQVFDGCPKKLKNYYLIKRKYNEGDEAISSYKYKSEYGAELVGMRFTVVKEQ